MIDGEGCIALYKKKDKKTRSGFSYASYLTITAKEKHFLEILQKYFGGYLNQQGKGAYKGTPMWSLRFSSNEMRELLPNIIPHLILKRKEAELLLQGLEITKNHRFSNYSPSGLDKIVKEIKLLKINRYV